MGAGDDDDSLRIEFQKDGKLILNNKIFGGGEVEGTYKVDGDKLMLDGNANEMNVTKLTDSELVLDGLTFRRLKADGKKGHQDRCQDG